MEEKDIFKKYLKHDFEQIVPSRSFTEEVMKKVDRSMTTKTLIEPLIPPKTWIIISSVIVVLLFCLQLIELKESFVDGLYTAYSDTLVFALKAAVLIILFLFLDIFIQGKQSVSSLA